MSIMVTVSHLREARLCARGARVWFDRNGLDFKEFLLKGLPIEQVEQIDDSLARLVVKVAREAEEP